MHFRNPHLMVSRYNIWSSPLVDEQYTLSILLVHLRGTKD